MHADDLILIEHISKRFGGVAALDNVSFSVRRGEVHAIMGENGAGKSTLMKLLAGVFLPDHGQIVLRGIPVRFTKPADARRLGISIVFQELNLFPHRSVAANIFANRELTHCGGLLDQRAMRVAATRTLADMGVDISASATVGDLPVGEQQLIEIARTLQEQSEIIILDEPNSALSGPESARLFEIVRRLRNNGTTILYVSHRLEEVFAIADRISVLRDGRYQATYQTADTSIPEIIAAMIGRRAQDAFPQREPVPADAPELLQVQGLCRGPRLGPIDFSARAGEIVGFAGLEGSGVDDIFRILFGLVRPTAGKVLYEGQPHAPRSPLQAIRGGWGLIPASRREQGLFMDWSIRRNATLLTLDRLTTRLGLIDSAATCDITRKYIQRFNIVTDSLDKRVVNLSGGNQQKVLLAKWLSTSPRILLLNDPTRGVDIGAKYEIYELCAKLAREGMAILFTSSELEETVGLCDRVLVLHKGRLASEFARGEASKAQIMHSMAGRSDVSVFTS